MGKRTDEEQPHPLPNLDFKIMQGNSLLESFEGIPLHHIKPLQAHLIEPRTLVDGGQQLGMFQTSVMQQTRLDLEQQATQQQHQDALEELLNSYFEVGDAPRKAILRKQIETQVHEHLAYNVDFRLAQAQRLLNESQAALDAIRLDPKDTAAKRQQKEKARNKQQKAVDTHQQAVTRLEGTTKRLDTLQDGSERPYFLWHLEVVG